MNELPVVTFLLTFQIPKGNVRQEPDEPIEKAIERTVQQMVLRLTDSYPYDYEFAPEDSLVVTVKIDVRDDPARKAPTDEMNEALDVIARMLGQRCTNPRDGYNDELIIKLHSDKAALDLLVKHQYADMHDINGKVTGYLHM